MKQNSKITIRQISSKLEMSESGVKKVIQKLKSQNKIKRIGSLKAGYWEII